MLTVRYSVHVVSSVLCTWIDAAASQAMPIYVDSDGTCVPRDGSSWCNAFADLQNALTAALPGTEVRVAEGTYRPDGGTGDRLATFLLNNGVVVVGGYASFGAINPDARDVTAFETILSGDLGGNDQPNFTNFADNSYHVVNYNDMNAAGVVLDGFTVSHGNADGTSPARTNTNQGGAVHIRDDSRKCIPGGPKIRNCTIRDNWAAHHGAVNDHGLASAIEGCTFVDNFSGEQGGGLYSESFAPGNLGSVLLANSIFWANTDDSGSVQAAQIFNDFDSAPVVSHSCVAGWDGSLVGTDILFSDPLISDPDGADDVLGTEDGNLHPDPDSLVIDAGDNAAIPPNILFDLAGNPRIDNGTVDMGVFELGGCGNQTCSAKENQCTCPGDCGTPDASEISCDDGVDNDCNALTDCQDPACQENAACMPIIPPIPTVSYTSSSLTMPIRPR